MRTVSVNGNNIYIIKVRVKDNTANAKALKPLKSIGGVTLTTLSSKNGRMIEINYFGLFRNISNDVFRKVGVALKKVQINNINTKYAWTKPYYCEEDVETDLIA